MKNKLLKFIYISSLLPLLFGTVTFFYWYYKKVWFAENTEIELVAFFTILSYFLLGIVTLILSTIYVYKQKGKWKNVISPVLIVLMTFPIIDLFSTVHTSFEQQAFVKLINDSEGIDILRIRSENFELTNFKEKETQQIVSYYPVYTFDWTQKISGDWYNYDIKKVAIDLKMKDDSFQSFEFPQFSKGECGIVRISEIIEKE